MSMLNRLFGEDIHGLILLCIVAIYTLNEMLLFVMVTFHRTFTHLICYNIMRFMVRCGLVGDGRIVMMKCRMHLHYVNRKFLIVKYNFGILLTFF